MVGSRFICSTCTVAVAWCAAADTLAAPAEHRGDGRAAIFPLEPRGGIATTTADMVSESLQTELRKTGAFKEVLGAADMEKVAGGTQAQLRDCHDDACMGEIAGALGVEYLISGSVGRIGGSYLLNVRVVRLADGTLVTSVSERLWGDADEALLDGVKPVVQKIAPGFASAAPTPARKGTTSQPASVSWRAHLFRGGIASLVAGLLGAVVALSSAAAAVTMRLVMPNIPGSGRSVRLWVPAYLGLGATGGFVLVAAIGLAGTGVALALSGLVVGP